MYAKHETLKTKCSLLVMKITAMNKRKIDKMERCFACVPNNKFQSNCIQLCSFSWCTCGCHSRPFAAIKYYFKSKNEKRKNSACLILSTQITIENSFTQPLITIRKGTEVITMRWRIFVYNDDFNKICVSILFRFFDFFPLNKSLPTQKIHLSTVSKKSSKKYSVQIELLKRKCVWQIYT